MASSLPGRSMRCRRHSRAKALPGRQLPHQARCRQRSAAAALPGRQHHQRVQPPAAGALMARTHMTPPLREARPGNNPTFTRQSPEYPKDANVALRTVLLLPESGYRHLDKNFVVNPR